MRYFIKAKSYITLIMIVVTLCALSTSAAFLLVSFVGEKSEVEIQAEVLE